MKDVTFEANEKLLNLETENARLKETISAYENKLLDMELDDMVEDGGELADMDGEAHNLHDYLAATNRMNMYFENKIEKLNKETSNAKAKKS